MTQINLTMALAALVLCGFLSYIFYRRQNASAPSAPPSAPPAAMAGDETAAGAEFKGPRAAQRAEDPLEWEPHDNQQLYTGQKKAAAAVGGEPLAPLAGPDADFAAPLPDSYEESAMPSEVSMPQHLNTKAGFDAPGLTGSAGPSELEASMASDLDTPSEAIVWKGSKLAASTADDSPTGRYSTLSAAEVRDLQDIMASRIFDADAYVGSAVLKRSAAV